MTPYHFGNGNPIYFNDPSGLISDALLDTIWVLTPEGGSSTWVNGGNGSFNFAGGSDSGVAAGSSVDGDGTFHQGDGTWLPNLTITRTNYYSAGNMGSDLLSSIQHHTYSNSPYYQYVRDAWNSAVLDDFQSSVGWLGVIDPTGIVDGLNSLGYLARGQYGNAAISAVAIIPFGDFAKGIKYTKSSLKLGREMHALYKAAEHAPELRKFKEFTGIKGIRPDFVDFTTNTIFELKPFNPRAMKAGERQLAKYKAAFEIEYPGTIWNTVLDTY